MDSGTVILDISSDDEDLGKIKSKLPSLEWISQALGGGDVVEVDNLHFDSKKSDSGDASDDDCVVLDGDPDKAVAVVQASGSEADELLIVGEKGQLACRDYPHPRHLCAVYPFRQTPHEEHCTQCHCYVCDSLAPCAEWGDGSSLADHCHANGRDDWGRKRQFTRKVNTSAQPGVPTSTTPLKHPVMPPNVVTSTTRTLINSAHLSISRQNSIPLTISQPPMPCSNRMDSISNQQVAAVIQANKKLAQVDALNRRSSVAPVSRYLQQVRRGEFSSVQHRPAFPPYKKARTTEPCNKNVLSNASSGQGQGVAAPPRRCFNQMALKVNQQPSVPVPCSNSQSFVPVASQNPSVTLPFRGHRTSPMPSALGNSQTAAIPRKNPRGSMHMEKLHPPANMERFNEILAGLESELGLSPDVCTVDPDHTTNSSVPHSQIYTELNVHVDACQAQATACTNSSLPNSNLLDGSAGRIIAECASAMGPQPQPNLLTAAPTFPLNDSLSLENNSLQGWASLIEQQDPSFGSLKDPGVLSPDPPNLIFDFEELWG